MPTASEPARPSAPKCELLAEHCTVDGSARLVLGSLVTVQPPAGWEFSTSEEQGIRIVPPQSGAIIAVVRLDGIKPDVVWPRLYSLLSELGIKGVEPKAVNLEAPQATWVADGLDIKAWQVEKSQLRAVSKQAKDPEMQGEPGALLVGLGQIDETNAVLAVAFLKRSAPAQLVEPIRQIMQGISRSVPQPISPPDSQVESSAPAAP